MIRELITETVKYMWRNKKNRLFMMVSLGIVFCHAVFILPNIPGQNEVDIEQLEREMLGNEQTMEDNLAEGRTVPSIMTGTSAYEAAANDYVNQRQLLTALKQGDARRYLSIDYRPEVTERTEVNRELEISLPVLGTSLESQFIPLKSQFYINNIDPLGFHTIHERTSFQQLHLFLIGLGPIILFLGAIFMISDVTVKDRKLKTQKAGVPMKWYTYLLVQSCTALFVVLCFYGVLTAVFFLVNGLLHGFGTVTLPIGAFDWSAQEGSGYSSPISLDSIGAFLVKALPYFLLFFYLITRLNTLFSLLFKQEVVVLIIGAFMILFQQLYYGPKTTELLGIDISWFPQTYLEIGKIVTGRVSEALLLTDYYSRGLMVIAAAVLITEGLNVIAAKKITRQAFVR